MIFHDAYITNDGKDLLSRAAAGLGELLWGQTATSSLDCSAKTDDQMREITTATFGTLTSLGDVKGGSYNPGEGTANIHCELNNRTYNGVVRLFGAWAKLEGDEEEVLVLVARPGAWITPTTIDSISNGLERAYVDVSIVLSDHSSIYVSVTEGYYALASELGEINDTVTDLALHVSNTYRDVWEALALAKEGETFGYLNNDTVIEMTGIDGDTFIANEVNPVWIQDGLFFFWYALARDYETPAHVVIASIDDLRKGFRTSLFNSTELLDWGFIEGGRCNPVYIDETMILYPMIDQDENSRYKMVLRSDYSLTASDFGILNYPVDLPSGLDLKKLQLSSAGNVAVYWNHSGTLWYVFGLKLSFSLPSGFIIESYDKIVSYTDPDDTISPHELTYFGKIGNKYFAGPTYLYISNDSGDFTQVRDVNSDEINLDLRPVHKNAILFLGNYGGYGVYSVTDITTMKATLLYEYGESTIFRAEGIGDSNGLSCPNCTATPYGIFPRVERHEDYDAATLPYSPIAICTDFSSYESGGETYYRLKLAPKSGDFSKCIRENGLIFPLL